MQVSTKLQTLRVEGIVRSEESAYSVEQVDNNSLSLNVYQSLFSNTDSYHSQYSDLQHSHYPQEANIGAAMMQFMVLEWMLLVSFCLNDSQLSKFPTSLNPSSRKYGFQKIQRICSACTTISCTWLCFPKIPQICICK